MRIHANWNNLERTNIIRQAYNGVSDLCLLLISLVYKYIISLSIDLIYSITSNSVYVLLAFLTTQLG